MNSSIRILSSLVMAVVLGRCHVGVHAAGADVDDAIRQARMGTLVVVAAPGVEVRVEQLRHEFWFGAALASGPSTTASAVHACPTRRNRPRPRPWWTTIASASHSRP